MELLVEQTQNLSNFFLLPLVKRSVKDFEVGTFINSYLDIETFSVVVAVENCHGHFKDFSQYDCSVEKGSITYIFYTIPTIFHEDVGSFVDGKYSEFSELGKSFIRKYGRLKNKQNHLGEIEKSVWLHVIDKSTQLKEALEMQLNTTIGEEMELATKPNANNFFNNV